MSGIQRSLNLFNSIVLLLVVIVLAMRLYNVDMELEDLRNRLDMLEDESIDSMRAKVEKRKNYFDV